MNTAMLTAAQNRQGRRRNIALYLLKILVLAIVYHLAARLGLKMAYVQINTSPVWPPSGIALAALLILGYNVWPGISLGVLIGSLITGAPINVALGITIGNTLEALCAAYLLRLFFRFHNPMDRIQDVVGLAICSVFSTSIGATIGTVTLMITGNGNWQVFWGLWSTWWIGDLLGALVVAPALLIWVSPSSFRLQKRQYVEVSLLLAPLVFVTWYVFGSKPPDGIFHQALMYVIFPFVIWAALRLEQHGATLAVFFISGIAIWGTVQELGPFSLESKNDGLILLQTYIAVVSLTSLILAAATIERRKAGEALQRHAEELATLNDASKTFLDSLDISGIYQTICRLAVARLGLDAAWVEMPAVESTETHPAAIQGLPAEMLAAQKTIWEGDSKLHEEHDSVIKTSDELTSLTAANSIYKSYASFPLVFGSKPIGALKLLSKSKDIFTQDRQMLIQSYTNLAAVAVQNTWLFDEARMSNRQLHALSQRLMKVQEDERLHLSRELHDESGQLLAALAVQLGLLERDADHAGLIRDRAAELKHTANSIQDNLHRLAVNLRPASLDHLGLVTTLQQFIREFSRQYNIKVEFEAVGMQDKRLPIEIETALFRCVQESLTNVVLHAQATRVDVLLSMTDKRVSAIVEDNGVGFNPALALVEDMLGLFGMRERIEMLGGTFTIESSPGQGTTVKAEVSFDD